MNKLKLVIVFIFCFSLSGYTQIIPDNSGQTTIQLENIEKNLGNISKSVNNLNEIFRNFSQTFSSNQGLRLTERQQRILAAFEYLNRAEQRLANLQNLKIDLTQKQTNVNLQLAQIEDDLRPESIDRSIALRGTTDAEELREIRRQALFRQKTDLQNLTNQISRDIVEIDYEIQQTQQFLRRIRDRIFPEIEKELSDL